MKSRATKRQLRRRRKARAARHAMHVVQQGVEAPRDEWRPVHNYYGRHVILRPDWMVQLESR